MFAYGILKVIYAPHKVFKEIIQNPKYIGPFLIMALFVAVSVGSQYARAAKLNVQQTLPSILDADPPWTENSTSWISNTNPVANDSDYLLSKSVQFSVVNDVTIWMEINSTEPIDCTGAGGYNNLTFSIKWINPLIHPPQNASLYLNSSGPADYFYRNITDLISIPQDNVWYNLSARLGPDGAEWVNSSSLSTWTNITGIRLVFDWPEPDRGNYTILVDRVFFLSPNLQSVVGLIGPNILVFVFNTIVNYAFDWMVFSIALWVATKVFHIQTQMKTLIVIVGYAFVAMLILKALFSVYFLVMPSLYQSIDVVTPTGAYANLVSFIFYATVILPIWSIAICAVALRYGFDLDVSKSALSAIIGFLPYYALLFIAPAFIVTLTIY